MGVDHKGVRFCDQCGRPMVKAHKLHQTGEYCGSCYPRLFPSVPCSRCSASARPHRNDPKPPLCNACFLVERRCIRCEKSVPRAALLIDGKAVCPSCAPYYRDEGVCAHCERVSSRLSTMPSEGVHEKICESCRNRFTHASCSACGKYRKVARRTEKGAICTGCADDPMVAHACPDCGESVPGVGNARCRSCANKIALDREIKLTAPTFANEWVEMLWHRFGLWLHAQKGSSPKLIATLRSHQIYFERLDATFSSAFDLTEASLLRLFGTATLRAHLLPTRFIEEQFRVEVSSEAKVDASERARLDELLRISRGESWGILIQSYVAKLSEEGLALRSMRM